MAAGKKISFGRNKEKDAALRQRLRRIRTHNSTLPALVTFDIGEKMEDGTIYAGISPITGHPMYAAPADAPTALIFNEAAEYARNLDVGGKQDFRLPVKSELKVLFENRHEGALKDSFNLTGQSSTGWYMSSAYDDFRDDPFSVTALRMKDGMCSYEWKTRPMSIRCVRG